MDRSGCASGCSAYSDQFVEVVAEKLLTYALGRGVEYQDMPLVRAIARDAAKQRQPVLGARARRRQEQAVSDEHEGVRTHLMLYGSGAARTRGRSDVSSEGHIPRRTFLQGAGVTLALPLLDAMVPAATAAGADGRRAEEPRSSGSSSRTGWRRATGCPSRRARFRRSCRSSSSRSKKVKDQTVVLSGLWSKSAEPPEGTTGSDHWVAAAYPDRHQAAQDRRVRRDRRQPDDRSDHRAEDRPGDAAAVAAAGGRGSELELEQLRRRLQLFVHELDLVDRPADAGQRADRRDEPAADGAQPAGRVRAAVRQRRDAGGARRAHAPEPQHPRFAARRAGRAAEGSRRRATAGPSARYRRDPRDRAPHSARGEGVERRAGRSICRRACRSSSTITSSCSSISTALAFQADITRVATLLGARDLTGRSYPFPKGELFPNGGVSVGFHGGSHHQDDPTQIRRYADLNRYHVSTLAYFAEKLRSIPDGDGTLLDHSLMLYGTNMGNSNQHQHYDVPHILVGGANGQLKGNRHLAYERKTVTTGNLLLNVLDICGIHQETAGRQQRPAGEADSSGAMRNARMTAEAVDDERSTMNQASGRLRSAC